MENKARKGTVKEIIDLEQQKEVNKVICECGFELESKWDYCPNCKKQVDKKTTTNDENINKKTTFNKNAKPYIIILIICFVIFRLSLAFDGDGLISKVFSCLGAISMLVGVVTIITGMIKSPSSNIIKASFWIIAIWAIFSIAIILFFAIACIGKKPLFPENFGLINLIGTIYV